MASIRSRQINGRWYHALVWWEKQDGKWKKKYQHIPRARGGPQAMSFLIAALRGKLPPHPDPGQVAYPKHIDPFEKVLGRVTRAEHQHDSPAYAERMYRDRMSAAMNIAPNFDLAQHIAQKEFYELMEIHRAEEVERLELEAFMNEYPDALREIFVPHLSETPQVLSQPVGPAPELETVPQSLEQSELPALDEASPPSEPETDPDQQPSDVPEAPSSSEL